MSTGTLHVAATPIGNLGDVTPRLSAILASCEFVLCEDTRRTRQLCSALGVSARLVRCDEHEEERRVAEVIEALQAGKDVALVSDAGTPAISDPGYRIVRAVHLAGLRCSPVPGPSSVTAALSVSGLRTTTFSFEGFPPRKRSARRRFLAALADEPRTIVLFESPWRARETLEDLCAIFGETRVAFLGRELTKLHEEARLSTLGNIRDTLAAEVKGEFVLVIASAPEEPEIVSTGAVPATRAALLEEIDALVSTGLSEKDALRQVARAHGLSKRDVYRLVKVHEADDEA